MNRENDNALPPPDDAAADSLDESEVARVFDAYLADLEAGRAVDPERLIADNPGIAGALRACLDVMSLADKLAGGADSPRISTTPREHGLRSANNSRATTTLQLSSSAPPRVQLRELPDDREPMVKPRSSEMPKENGASIGRFQLQGEIARGGMGAILKGRDVDLGRDLAIKVMLESHQGNPDVVNRFIEEAQIGGQLQHPGIVPVYELGAFPDRRPYFAMKLVKGRTLASLLAERKNHVGRESPDPALPSTEGLPSPPADLPRFLAIFEQVCQTMAYAHARGVIHRDLKPSNVMVGSFGEVQVMDWGLAKVLPSGGIADEAATHSVHETVIATIRSGPAGSGSESQAGSVLGTPAYMAPEQARGEVERIDERADVFGLGAILCEILTGRPPYSGSTREQIRAQAARGDLTEALARLDASRADIDLIALAKACLAAEAERRLRNAGVVVDRVTAYLTGVQERLKAAELAQVEAQTRAEEATARATIERSRRRRTAALASSVLVMAASVVGVSTYFMQQQQQRAMKFNQALGEAEGLYAEALRVGDDLSRWFAAREAAHVVEGLLVGASPDRSTQTRLSALVRDVDQAVTAAENDRELVSRLDEIRSGQYEDGDGTDADAGYGASFREAGIDIDELSPADAGAKIKSRPASVRVALTTTLDEWADVRSTRNDKLGARRIAEAAREADPDLWRNRFRELYRSPLSAVDALRMLRNLVESAPIDELPPVSLHLLGLKLRAAGDSAGAEKVLRKAQRRYPSDVWLNRTLAGCLSDLGRKDEAIWYYYAAHSLRPELSHLLAHALWNRGQRDEAIAVFQDLIARVDLKHNGHQRCLAEFLRSLGRTKEGDAVLEAAVARTRAEISRHPNRPQGHVDCGHALQDLGRLDEAAAEYRHAFRLRPENSQHCQLLVNVLSALGKFDESIAVLREAIRLRPDSGDDHYELAMALRRSGRFEESLAEMKRSGELGGSTAGYRVLIKVGVRQAERLVELDRKLPTILSGQAKPSDAAEILILAQLCYDKKLHGASAHFWSEAFQAQPKVADNMRAQNRYNAACAAALAGCGQGKDDPPLDDTAQARWRKQAIDWLTADFAAWSKGLGSGPPQARQAISQTLQHWKADPDLAGIREPAVLAKLPAGEQTTYRNLWSEVDALLAKTGAKQAP